MRVTATSRGRRYPERREEIQKSERDLSHVLRISSVKAAEDKRIREVE